MKRLQLFGWINLLIVVTLLAGCRQPVAVREETAVAPTAPPVIDTLPSASSTPTAPRRPTPTAPPISQGVPSLGDPYAPELGNTGYDVLRYDMALAIEPSDRFLKNDITITAVATLPNLGQLSLDFVGFEIERVAINGAPVPFSRDGPKLWITPTTPLTLGEQFDITISYQGTPTLEPSPYVVFLNGLGMRFAEDETVYVLSEPDGARYWFPNNDHPRDKATYQMAITVPAGKTAVSNGLLLVDGQAAELPSGAPGETFVWAHTDPMASYLAVVAVGEYDRIESVTASGIPIRHYVFPEERAAFETAVGVTDEALSWLSERLGPYPFEAIGFVTASVPSASLETQTMVLLSTNMLNETTVIHELVHMWFGNHVSLDTWAEMWRNEGFAVYFSLLWAHRADPAGLEREMAAIEAAVLENRATYPLNEPPPEALFSFSTYFKGAVAAYQLHQLMGDDAFFAGLRAYFAEYGGGTASDAEFQQVMEAAYGASLDSFFAEWVRSP